MKARFCCFMLRLDCAALRTSVGSKSAICRPDTLPASRVPAGFQSGSGRAAVVECCLWLPTMDRGFVRVYCNSNLIVRRRRHKRAAQSCAGTGLPGLGGTRVSASTHDWLLGCQKRARQQGMVLCFSARQSRGASIGQRIAWTVLSPGEA